MKRKSGLRRWPVLTIVVVAVTLAVNIAQLVSSHLLDDLERTPAALHGDWWRLGTTLLVQDGGAFGMVSNLLFTVLLGIVAEQVVARWQWIVCYLGAAAIGIAVALSWQPVGGGNSVANCGLAAIIVIALVRRDHRLPELAAFVALLWAGVLLSTQIWQLGAIGFAAAFASRPFVRHRRLGPGVLVLTTAIGIYLCIEQNIHGAAMLGGLLIAAALDRISHRQSGDALDFQPSGSYIST